MTGKPANKYICGTLFGIYLFLVHQGTYNTYKNNLENNSYSERTRIYVLVSYEPQTFLACQTSTRRLLRRHLPTTTDCFVPVVCMYMCTGGLGSQHKTAAAAAV